MKIEFENAAGETLAGRLELPPTGSPRAFALFAHCFTCGKDIAAATRIARALAARGFGVLRFDFTGLGGSDGDFANTSFTSNVEDLVAAAAWLRAHHRAPDLLVGHSLGGAAVLVAAPRIPEVDAVATIGAPSDVGHVAHLFAAHRDEIQREGCRIVEIAGRPFPISRRFVEDLAGHRLLTGLDTIGKAVLVMHSPIDEVVGIDHARRLYQALRHPKSFVTLDDADHLLRDPKDAEYVAEVLAAWASRYLDPIVAEPDAALAQGEVLVRERSPGSFTQDVRIGRHRLVGDEPEKVGGADLGPDPYGLLLAALGTCTAMTLRMYASHKSLPIRGIQVRLSHQKLHAKDCEDCEGMEGRVDLIERVLEIDAPELDEAQRQRLLEIADRCPVHRTFEGQKHVRTRLG
jgi:putative redox protein